MKINIRIALSQRIDFVSEINEYRDSIDIRMIEWIMHIGGIPFPVPNNLYQNGELINWLNTISPEAIILSGGNDIGKYKNRDETEKLMINFAKDNNIPLLGICRGMQMIAFNEGSNLEKVSNHCKIKHSLKIVNNKLDFPSEVNSFHNWRLKDCPESFDVTAYSLDGTIEAILHKNLPLAGWMWHPERDAIFSDKLITMARSLFLLT